MIGLILAAAVLTNSMECLLILLASAAIGAIFSSTSPDMGALGIIERYSQVRPKLLFVETQVQYGRKLHDYREKMHEAATKLHEMVPELLRTIVISGPLFQAKEV